MDHGVRQSGYSRMLSRRVDYVDLGSHHLPGAQCSSGVARDVLDTGGLV